MREEDSSRWYFAFGSNMESETFINSRKMSPLSKEVARLSGFELVFDQKGIPVVEPAFASIRESKDSEVWGVLYKLSKEDFERLHYTEGDSYEVRSIEVQGNVNGLIQCSTYIGRESKPGLTPSRRYLRKLISGAVQHELPDDYINKLKLYKSTYVPVASEVAGLLIKILLWHSSKGKTVNLIVSKSGASYSAPEKENV
jgi:cation transport regulator ChaC